jgi:hypothetical protein
LERILNTYFLKNGGEAECIYIECWWKSQEIRDHWEDQDVSGWTILKWILEREDRMEWIGWIWLRIGTSGGLL